MTNKIEQMEHAEKIQRDVIHDQVVLPNKDKGYHLENTKKLNKARDIFKESSGLDNITEFDMTRFRQIMLG